MSMDNLVFGAIRPPSGSCDERGKLMRLVTEPAPEPEPESDSESESESEPEEEDSKSVAEEPWSYSSKPFEELVLSDFTSRYDDDPNPYYFACPRFVYMNDAMKKQQEEANQAVDDYLDKYDDLSPFDAVEVPELANVCGNNFPRPVDITDDNRLLLTDLSKLALKEYNDDNQEVKYEFVELVKATRSRIPLTTYYITFKAKDATHVDPSNCPATTFQAQVWNKLSGQSEVDLCSIKA